MLLFLDCLNELIEKRNTTMKRMADDLKIDRTMLHKILNGTRRPPSEEFVDDMLKFLMANEKEKAMIKRLYRISCMGEEVYARRQMVEEIIQYIYDKKCETDQSIFFKVELDIESMPAISQFYSKKEFIRSIQTVLSYDVQNGSDVNIIAQPSRDLNCLLNYCIDDNMKSEINHIFCMDKSPYEESSNINNLENCLYVCEFAFEYEKYKPYYYYENMDSSMSLTNVLPYIIITDNFVICSDITFSCGVIYRSKHQAQFYKRKFEQIKAKSEMLIKSIEDISLLLAGSRCKNTFLMLHNYHSLNELFGEKRIEKNINIPREAKAVSLIQKTNNCKYISVISRYDIECAIRSENSAEDKKLILRQMIEDTKSDICNYRLIKERDAVPQNKLSIAIVDDRLLIEVSFFESNSPRYISIGERSIAYAFQDYIDYFYKSERLYNKENTIEILEEYIYDN